MQPALRSQPLGHRLRDLEGHRLELCERLVVVLQNADVHLRHRSHADAMKHVDQQADVDAVAGRDR